jgi:predicted metal-dependent phosphoesterase TrpH
MPTFDLHTHSSFSDGLLTPTELVIRAAKNGVTHLALTDHDEVAGLAEAHRAAKALVKHSLRVIDGIECSALWETRTLHIAGLFIDPTNPNLIAALNRVKAGRKERAVKISARLAELGISGALEGARRFVTNDDLISRAHFGRFLVADGRVRTTQLAFDRYLGRGKLAYIAPPWLSVQEVVSLIHEAGGLAVLAHPARYSLQGSELRVLLQLFKDTGGDAIEIITPSHSGDDITRFVELARYYGLAGSLGSDFHGDDEELRYDLGRCPPLPEGVTPVWSLRPESL